MAKQPQKSPFQTFEIPTNALAKTAPKENSVAWMRKQAIEHGSTDEQRLEKRRRCLSAYLLSMESHLKQLQMQKKLFFADSQKREKETLEGIEKADPKSDDAAKLQQQLSNILAIREQQKTQFGMVINQQMYQMAMLDAQCLCVDMMSIQIRGVEGKGGKKGTIRASMSVYAMDAAEEAGRVYRRIRKFTDAVCGQYGIVLPTADPDDWGDDESNEYDDDDVVDEHDAKKIKEAAGGGEDEFEG